MEYGETSASKPPTKCRKCRDEVKTGKWPLARDKSGSRLQADRTASGMKGGVTPYSGLDAERGNLSSRCEGSSASGGPVSAGVPKRGTGAEQPVVAAKPGNAGGAKGLCKAGGIVGPTHGEEERGDKAKPFKIDRWQVWEAYRQVRAKQGGAGVDGQTIAEFELKLKDNLYRIWNRMSSGTYFPPPVKRVMIPKSNGGERPLGIPTVGDRVAQMVVKQVLEPVVEPLFHPDSYGYRPGKSAHDALSRARERCWALPWAIDLDIKGLFDNIDHDLMLKAVRHYTANAWVRLYVERWLKAPV